MMTLDEKVGLLRQLIDASRESGAMRDRADRTCDMTAQLACSARAEEMDELARRIVGRIIDKF